jgi:site-specific DNA-methyltransferase (adenine-specific)
MDAWKNQLYVGDNLDFLRKGSIPVDSVDLIYLDPPFNSNATYNVLFREKTGEESVAQIGAFEDTWQWGPEAAGAYNEIPTLGHPKLSDLMNALRGFLGANDMMAYLCMMAVRLVELHRVLKPTGSLYLHCDPTASHFIKLLLDAIFGTRNFRNEIVWKRFHFHSDAKRFGRVTDRIFYYSKSSSFIFNKLRVPFSEKYISDKFIHTDKNGRKYRLDNLNPPANRGPVYEFYGVTKAWRYTKEKMLQLDKEGRIYTGSKIPQLKRYLDEIQGQAIHDLWADIAPINPQAKERLGYPTQKPEALLERIIRASSNEGDLILDPFCGCGTTIAVAERLHRRWIGMDITHLAVNLIKDRLRRTFENELSPIEEFGDPKDVAGARSLWERSPYEFEWWALGKAGATAAQDKRKGADRGVDGVIYFRDDDSGAYKKIILQVKGGKVGAAQVRDIKGVLARDKAQIGALLTLNNPTRAMLQEADAADFYKVGDPEKRFPRIQILTIADLFAGKKLYYPQWAVDETFKKAPRQRKGPKPADNQKELL